MMRQRKRGVDARMVGVARPDPVRNNGAVARFNQRVEEVAVEESPRGISVQEQHGPRATAALVDVGHVAAVDAQRFLLPWEELSKPCGLFAHGGWNRNFRSESPISTTHIDGAVTVCKIPVRFHLTRIRA